MYKHILIVEDEQKIVGLLRDYLEKAGFKTSGIMRGDKVVSRIRQSRPDLVLLDIMLPGMDGMEVCREIRKISNVPIIMITARVEEIDRLLGLELGADDYICKPFSPREVVARVKAILRRISREPEDEELAIGPVILNENTHEVRVNNQPLTLTPSEFNLLKLLMNYPGRVFSRSDLIDKVLGYDFEGYERTIDSHVKNLRKKIFEHYPDKEIILSIYGVGYKLNATF